MAATTYRPLIANRMDATYVTSNLNSTDNLLGCTRGCPRPDTPSPRMYCRGLLTAQPPSYPKQPVPSPVRVTRL